jgi:hypothetical protein
MRNWFIVEYEGFGAMLSGMELWQKPLKTPYDNCQRVLLKSETFAKRPLSLNFGVRLKF